VILGVDFFRFSVIHYLSKRLVWIDTAHSLRIGDALGNYTAAMLTNDETVTMVTVKHDSLHRYPGLVLILMISCVT